MTTWKNVADGLLDKTWSLKSKTYDDNNRDSCDAPYFTYLYKSITGDCFTSDNNLEGTKYYLCNKYKVDQKVLNL
jgi:hypothetical protein